MPGRAGIRPRRDSVGGAPQRRGRRRVDLKNAIDCPVGPFAENKAEIPAKIGRVVVEEVEDGVAAFPGGEAGVAAVAEGDERRPAGVYIHRDGPGVEVGEGFRHALPVATPNGRGGTGTVQYAVKSGQFFPERIQRRFAQGGEAGEERRRWFIESESHEFHRAGGGRIGARIMIPRFVPPIDKSVAGGERFGCWGRFAAEFVPAYRFAAGAGFAHQFADFGAVAAVDFAPMRLFVGEVPRPGRAGRGHQ